MSASHGCRWLVAVVVVAAAGLAYAAPAHAQGDQVTVPDLTGKTVKAANITLERAGLRPAGDRLVLRASKGTRLEFAAVKDRARVTNQSETAGTRVARDTVVSVGTERRGQLLRTSWSRIDYEHGRVVLRGLQRTDCTSYDHVTIGPAINGARQISVWGVLKGGSGSCHRPTTLVLHTGPGWTRATIGVPSLPAKPDPTWTTNPRATSVRATLMPDRRTVYASYTRGACERMNSASATVDGSTVTLRVVVGNSVTADPMAPCIMVGISESVLIRLPAPAPGKAKFVSATS